MIFRTLALIVLRIVQTLYPIKENSNKPSVREELRKIRETRRLKENREAQRDKESIAKAQKSKPTTTHTQPQPSSKPKQKMKGSR